MTTKIANLNIAPDLKQALIDIQADLAQFASLSGTNANIGNLVTTATALVADLAAWVVGTNATGTALNGSADVADTDYVTNAAKTAVAPTASTVAAVGVTATAIVADLATFATGFNTLSTKLNADATVTDTNYVTTLAKTALAPVSNDIDALIISLGTAVVDMAAFIAVFNTRQTKITADCAGTYAALAAATSAAPAVASAITLNTSAS